MSEIIKIGDLVAEEIAKYGPRLSDVSPEEKRNPERFQVLLKGIQLDSEQLKKFVFSNYLNLEDTLADLKSCIYCSGTCTTRYQNQFYFGITKGVLGIKSIPTFSFVQCPGPVERKKEIKRMIENG